jgi:abequosyltransferase
MQPEQPLLTIAIPTYNRAADIAKMLALLSPQIKDDSRVEVIISDNASKDETAERVADFQADGMEIRYFRNEANLGPDGNILQCYEQAAGKYVWVFGDDDLILPGGVERVLQVLSGQELEIIFCAPCGYRHDHIEEMRSAQVWCRTEITEDVFRFVRMATRHHDLACISAVIVNKNAVSGMGHPKFEQMLGTNLVQLGWYFTALKNFRRGAFIERGTVVGKMENSSGGFNAIQVFGLNYAKAVTLFIDDNPRLIKTLINDQLFFWFSANWKSIRLASNADHIGEYDRMLRLRFGGNPRYWLVVYPLLSLPLAVSRVWSTLLFALRQLSRVAVRFYA